MAQPKLVAAIALSLLAGAAIGWFARPQFSAEPDAPAAQAEVNAGTAIAASRRGRFGNATAPLPTFGNRPSASVGNLELPELIRRYSAEKDPERKYALLQAMLQKPVEQLLPAALSLANAASPAQRLDGMALLGNMPFDREEVRTAFLDTLGKESDPVMQVKMLDQMSVSPLPAEDRAQVLEHLQRLARSEDPNLRAASVMQAAQWDSGAGSEETLHRALLDPSEEVRNAAAIGAQFSTVRTSRLKDALLLMVSDSPPGSESRDLALQALARFDLSRAEYEIYRNAADDLKRDRQQMARTP